MNENKERHYWSYKIDSGNIDFFWNELQHGRLRQGWGYKDSFNLSLPERDISGGNQLNYNIYDRVKKGDILLILRLPTWNKVALVEATEDFDKGYKFEMVKEFGGKNFIVAPWQGDFGHIFPAKFIKSYVLGSAVENAGLRKAMGHWPPKPRIRSIDHLKEQIEIIIKSDDEKLNKIVTAEERVKYHIVSSVFSEHFNTSAFADGIYNKFCDQFTAAGWEKAIATGLRALFPSYSVEETGGAGEKKHGTDILVRIPSIVPEHEYIIAIQVKDYGWVVQDNVLNQIGRADFWETKDKVDVVDKVLIVIKAEKDDNSKLSEKAKEMRIKIIFADQLKELFYNIAISYLGIDSSYIS